MAAWSADVAIDRPVASAPKLMTLKTSAEPGIGASYSIGSGRRKSFSSPSTQTTTAPGVASSTSRMLPTTLGETARPSGKAVHVAIGASTSISIVTGSATANRAYLTPAYSSTNTGRPWTRTWWVRLRRAIGEAGYDSMTAAMVLRAY
jgi:hypothetical protein